MTLRDVSYSYDFLVTMKHFVLCQAVASLERCLCFVKHVIYLLHCVRTKLCSFLFLGIFYQMLTYPAHVADAKRTIEIFK